MINYNLSLQCFDTVGWQKKVIRHTQQSQLLLLTQHTADSY